MTADLPILLAVAFACLLVLLGECIGRGLPLPNRIRFPGAVLGGLIALVAGPQLNPAWPDSSSRLKSLYEAVAELPPLFITVVFACLLLGKPIRSIAQLWKRAKPQVVMGHLYAWGQYVVGLGVTLILLAPLFDLNALAGATIAIGFQGGHGTAAGLTETFQELDFEAGKTIAYSLATLGIVCGTVLGPLLAGMLKPVKSTDDKNKTERDPAPPEERETPAESTGELAESPLTGTLTLQLGVLLLVIAAGWGVLQALQWTEGRIRTGDDLQLFTSYIPLFSVVLITGFLTQLLVQALGVESFLHRPLLRRISGLALDLVIFGAIATLNLSTAGSYWLPILILFATGLGWNLFLFFVVGPRLYPDPWPAYGLGDLGGGTATTASGLLLIRVADPEGSTLARESYSAKQPFYEPLMGGGLVTAFALPLIATLGPWICLLITAAILFLWSGLAWRMRQRADG